ncbi:MAG: hypothetical protein QXY50_02825 [Candidatus Caldarchaeum sp.]
MPSRNTALIMVLLAAVAAGIAFYGVFQPMVVVSTQRITLFNNAEIRCDDLRASFLLLRIPSSARLYIDTDPSNPGWPFYYGGIVSVSVNGYRVKSYDPPLVDKDEIDIVDRLQTGFNEVVLAPKVAALLCAVQTQGTVTAYIEAVYTEEDGGEGGGGGVGGGTPVNTVILVISLSMTVAAVYMLVKRRG